MTSILRRLVRRLVGRRTIEFDPEWEDVLRAGFDHWSTLGEDELHRMRYLVARFVVTTRWEAARGMDLTDDVKVLIAGQAAMLLLGLDVDEYPDLSSVIVHRSTVRLRGARPSGGGTWTDGVSHLSGQASPKGAVVLSWAAARRGALGPHRGSNVVYHEFAHRLDMLDGVTDGTPPLGDPDAVRQWADVCDAAFARVGNGESLLRPYAATNPAEFFAVATEMFFDRPIDLRSEEPDLYAELASFYGQDPAVRAERNAPADH